MGRVTLQTIADAVGVSRMTVSNAFSRPDQLSAELREKILATATELGYAGPDPAARGLARGTAGTVGIVLTDSLAWAFDDEVASRFVGAIATELAPTGKAITLLVSNHHDDEFIPARDVALDGALVYLCDDQSPAVEWLTKRRLPMVFVDDLPRPGYDSVNIDDREGARLASQHLIDLGHRHVGILTNARRGWVGPLDPAQGVHGPTSRARLDGWREPLDAAGIDPVVIQVDLHRDETIANGIDMLLDHEPRPTAILCFSDVLAARVVEHSEARGLRVPTDLSVVGFDGTQLAGWMQPRLTTVRQDVTEKGRAAAQALVKRMAGSTSRARHLRLPVELVLGESTAPPP